MHTREMHLKMAECLKEAKQHLSRVYSHEYETGKEIYVCTAVSRTRKSRKTKVALHDWINQQLAGYTVISSWARMNGANLKTISDYQEYRHAWVDHMIKVLES